MHTQKIPEPQGKLKFCENCKETRTLLDSMKRRSRTPNISPSVGKFRDNFWNNLGSNLGNKESGTHESLGLPKVDDRLKGLLISQQKEIQS
jgi:hypothetical protein